MHILICRHLALMQAKAMAGADGKVQTGGESDLPPAHFGAKYEQHVGALQKELDEAKKT